MLLCFLRCLTLDDHQNVVSLILMKISQITGREHVDVLDNSETLTQQKEHETAVKINDIT